MGPGCASWGLPARATSKRNFINVMGAAYLPFVASSNCTISRHLGWDMGKALGKLPERIAYNTKYRSLYIYRGRKRERVSSYYAAPRMVLVCMLLCARHCYYVVEHPFQSLICRHPRWEYFCNKVNYAACRRFIHGISMYAGSCGAGKALGASRICGLGYIYIYVYISIYIYVIYIYII